MTKKDLEKQDYFSLGATLYFLKFGEKMAATKADVCLVLSKNMKEYIKKTYNKDSVLFANGIDKPQIIKPNIIKEKYGLKKNSYLLSLGRIVPEKGLHYLIEAFKKCDTNKELIIAGGSEANSDYYNKLELNSLVTLKEKLFLNYIVMLMHLCFQVILKVWQMLY